MSKKFRILSIDGGGLRGIVPILILKELEKRTGRRIHEMFDLIAGTSTGGLIASILTVSDDGITPKFTLSEIEKMYTERGQDIFPPKKGLNKLLNNVAALKKPKYSSRGLSEVLKYYLGKKRMTDCLKPLFIVSYDLNNNEALLFKSRKAFIDPSANALLYDIGRATSAAPTYLPSYTFMHEGKKRTCIDGGVYMNNPVIGALVEISKYKGDKIYNRSDLRFEDICVLSLGTGHYTADIVKNKVDGGGLLDWAAPITDVMMQGVNQVSCYEAAELLENGNFQRITIDIEEERFANMTDSSAATRDYLTDKVNTDIIGNVVQMKQLDEFMNRMAEPLVMV